MTLTDTERALAAMTDEGVFEKLATAVLRTAEPLAAALIHTGVNVEGKTHASPIDGLHFVRGANPPHLVMAQHTITAAKQLQRKWLYDRATAPTPSKGRRPAEIGDVIKAAEQARGCWQRLIDYIERGTPLPARNTADNAATCRIINVTFADKSQGG